jgi:CMP-2-keto-3-deoxyoctulosonic acid synthetase
MSTAAVIIAKGSSRRIPRKNMMDIAGRPMFTWSVIQSKYSHFIDKVYVSTDNSEIYIVMYVQIRYSFMLWNMPKKIVDATRWLHYYLQVHYGCRTI